MVNSAFALNGYKTTQRNIGSHRSVEARIMSSITARMRAADLEKPEGYAELAGALHDNVELWTRFTVDLLGDGNQLPADLKKTILELAEFTRKYTYKILQSEASVTVLVDINRAIIAGLNGIPPEQDALNNEENSEWPA